MVFSFLSKPSLERQTEVSTIGGLCHAAATSGSCAGHSVVPSLFARVHVAERGATGNDRKRVGRSPGMSSSEYALIGKSPRDNVLF